MVDEDMLRIKELEAENAKLVMKLNAEHIVRQNLSAENAKLRELVKDMVLNIGGCALHGNPLRLREFGSRAKELGIEVDA